MNDSDLAPYILTLLSGDSVRGKVKLVLQLFLISKDILQDRVDFKFFPYLYGPYSSVVAKEFNSLIEQGHVVMSKSGNTFLFELVESGQELLKQYDQDPEIIEKIQSLKKSTTKLRVKDMTDIVWSKYPEYMVNAWGY